ncbi:hypothetical protein B4135_2375 [Caldibacillus debilis]|uniref:Uncharacterized protein n=1 Tax=Caldibacillus debilis TaxID=301148 RepID=A0A150LZA4_9BACI|nr:hypothetical protein B4135_2375 [Caldibacillus debilis]
MTPNKRASPARPLFTAADSRQVLNGKRENPKGSGGQPPV